jgi:tetratricopeptide (TPR) repeat protein
MGQEGRMIDLDRYYLAVIVEAGFIYLGMQRFKEAKQVFEGAKVIAPDVDIPIVALGNVEFCEGNFKKAIRHYDDALKVDADSLFAKVYKGEALFFNEERDEALELLREVKKKDPRGSAGGFAIALLDAIKDGFSPNVTKESHAKKKQKKSGR